MTGNKILIGKVTLENFLIFIFTFVLSLIVANIVYAVIRSFLDKKLPQRNSKLIARIIQYAVLTAGLYYGIYHVLHLDLTALAASMGIFGIAVAFSSQQIIQNFIAGILISIGRPIELEEWVEITGPIQTGISKIKDITLTRTILRDMDGRLLYLPNFILLSSKIINYTKSGFVEIPVQVTIPLGSDYERIKKTIKEVVNEHAKILPNVPEQEKSIIMKLFKLSRTKRLFDEETDISMFEPRILISNVSGSDVTLAIKIWIREINKKDEIVSEFLDSLRKKFKEEKDFGPA
jgi:small conductance mechanosensitive channel